MTKEQKAKVWAWGIYWSFMAYYVAAYITQDSFLLRHLELVVNVDLWIFTLIPALLMAGGVAIMRRNIPSMLREMREKGATEENIANFLEVVRPKVTGENGVALVSALWLSIMVSLLGLHFQAIAMLSITVLAHSVLILLPIKKVDEITPVI